jgi:hypothetical protein
MTTLIRLVSLNWGLYFVLSRISSIASGLALLEDEQKFKLGDVLALIKRQFHAPTSRVNV